ncbi:hypothetical protein ABKN59_005307 [Abortiporus biennis]
MSVTKVAAFQVEAEAEAPMTIYLDVKHLRLVISSNPLEKLSREGSTCMTLQVELYLVSSLTSMMGTGL